MNIILASTSPYRRQQLQQLGLKFEAHAPAMDEEALKDPSLPPGQLAEMLAQAKAKSLQAQFPENLIIGSDQLVHFQGLVLGKAGSKQKAVEQLLQLAGSSHELVTSVCVLAKGQAHLHTDITCLKMRPFSQKQLAAYVDRDQSWDCAGSYKLEKTGVTLFEKIESEDHSAIIGLPLLALNTMLLKLGVKYPYWQ